MQRTVVIGPNKVWTENTKGRVFVIHAATAQVDVEVGDRGVATMTTGGRVGSSSEERFHRVRLYERTGGTVTVRFEISDRDVSVNIPSLSSQTVEDTTPVSGITLIAASDTVQSLASGSTDYFVKLWLYPAKSVGDGVLVPNAAGDIYAGLTATHLPDKRATTDVDYPIVIEATPGRKISLAAVRIRGKATDGVCYVYLPA